MFMLETLNFHGINLYFVATVARHELNKTKKYDYCATIEHTKFKNNVLFICVMYLK